MHDKIQEILDQYSRAIVKLLPNIIIAGIILLITLLLSFIVARIIKKRIQKHSTTLMGLLIGNVIRLLILTIGFSLAFSELGFPILAKGLIAGAGISGIILGFAFKEITENFLAGTLLAFKSPFRVDDFIESGAVKGTVVAMDLYFTQIKSLEGNDVFLPNSLLLKNILINHSYENINRQDFTIEVEYKNQIISIEPIVLEGLKTMSDVMQEEKYESSISIEEIKAKTVKLKVYFWVNNNIFKGNIAQLKIQAIECVKNILADKGFYLADSVVEVSVKRGG